MNIAVALTDKILDKLKLVLKISISIYALWFISHQDFNLNFSLDKTLQIWSILLIFSILNWFFEIKKWQFLAGNIQNISFYTAFKQSLISFSWALVTPNRIGEYGAKAYFYKALHRKNILGLIFIGNLSQLFTTIIFGIIAVIFLNQNDYFLKKIISDKIWFIVLLSIISIVFLYIIYKKVSIEFIINFKLLKNSFFYSVLRYLAFSTQFFLLYWIVEKHGNLFQILNAIYLTYLLASLVPVLTYTDWAVKGGIATWVFSKLGLSITFIIQIVGIMWIFNFIIPFILGILFMWNFNRTNS